MWGSSDLTEGEIVPFGVRRQISPTFVPSVRTKDRRDRGVDPNSLNSLFSFFVHEIK